MLPLIEENTSHYKQKLCYISRNKFNSDINILESSRL